MVYELGFWIPNLGVRVQNQVQLSLSSFQGRSNEYQEFLMWHITTEIGSI